MIIKNVILFYLVSLIILVGVFIFGIRKNTDNNNCLNKENTDSLRGIAITCIVFHHIVQ